MSNEERENQHPRRRVPGLGELTRSLGTERRELEAFDLDGQYAPPGQGAQNTKSADLQRQTGIIDYTENRPVPKRPPPLLYEVVSTYDSRPIQGRDFQASGCNTIVFEALESTLTFDAVQFDYEVPENNVAVLRKFRYFLAPQMYGLEGTSGCWLRSDILIDDRPVDQYNDMRHGQFLHEPIDAFVIIDELRTLSIKLSLGETMILPDQQGPDLAQTGVMFYLYGNLLVKTGVPKEFEIANPIGGGKF